jgi:hypothetical protein
MVLSSSSVWKKERIFIMTPSTIESGQEAPDVRIMR